MPTYDVEVTVTGNLRVEAESPEEAEAMAEIAPPRLAGTKVLSPDIEAEAQGEVHVLDPDNMRHKMKHRH